MAFISSSAAFETESGPTARRATQVGQLVKAKRRLRVRAKSSARPTKDAAAVPAFAASVAASLLFRHGRLIATSLIYTLRLHLVAASFH